jgi:hypothetical protein
MADENKIGYVYHAELLPDELSTLLAQLFDTKAAAIVRRVNGAAYPAFKPSLLDEWSEGQVFNDKAELRWRRKAEKFAVLLLTEEEQEGGTFQPVKGAPFTVAFPTREEKRDSHGLLLWGTRLDENRKCWWETRIPRALHYPNFPVAGNNAPPRLSYKLYREGETVRWIRLVKLVEDANQ